MSLLSLNPSEERCGLAREVLERHWQHDPQLSGEFDDRQKKLILQDISYGIECLWTSVRFQSKPIFADHARWMHDVLINRLAKHTPERVKQMLITHYQSMGEVFVPTLPPEQAALAEHYLQAAIDAIVHAPARPPAGERVAVGPYAELRRKYLGVLLEDDRIGAIQVIMEAHHAGAPVPELYVEVLQPAMYQVGQLWQQGELTSAQEHRCALNTQGVMARLSGERVDVERHGKSIIACSVGDELHEIGVRMICDIFELNGWDSLCLGAAVPIRRMLQAVDRQEADLLALSVTMPIHLDYCFQAVQAARERFGNLRIAVGGRPFRIDPDLWRRWPVDICVGDAVQLMAWAQEAFGLR